MMWKGKETTPKWGGKKSAGGWTTNGKRCYHDHPVLKLKCTTGEDVEIFGGSCGSPVWDDCDIYIGLDYSMKDHPHRFPWHPGHAIHYKITDMKAPEDPVEFKQLIDWLCTELRQGARVHVGCIGGHGRTGLVLSALTATLTESQDPIGYVRENYCKKAVESEEQVEFLVQHFHCAKALPVKTYATPKKTSTMTRVGPVRDAPMYLFGDYEVTPF
jgi:hypothetical protein